uniref:histidine kinase n=1 Tax=Roseihalotalea indica TaxID=2867963 RepID=A0AA49GTX1_9BACT|nr:GAF domain-containing sensor histidine kinase [Tunicatimonas sp. TK19036]
MKDLYPPLQHEERRLQELEKYHIVDTPPEKEYDDLIKLASQICRAPIAFISFLERDRQWFKAQLGIDIKETPRELAFCHYTIQDSSPQIVTDTLLDNRFRRNPMVKDDPKIRFYAGFPLITSNHHCLGALCVADRAPRNLSHEQQFALEVLARQIVNQLELRLRNGYLQKSLKNIRNEKPELPAIVSVSQSLLSIISHDLTGPVATTKGFLELLKQKSLSADEENFFIDQINKTLESTEVLLRNLIVWTRMQLQEDENATSFSLSELVEEVTESLSSVTLEKKNELHNDVEDGLVVANRQQVIFILKTLIYNANKFTEKGNIQLTGRFEEGNVQISIADSGIGMSQAQIISLLRRKKKLGILGTAGERGNGLGLLITQEFIQKMGGTLFVESKDGCGSTFHFSFPSNAELTAPDVMFSNTINGTA